MSITRLFASRPLCWQLALATVLLQHLCEASAQQVAAVPYYTPDMYMKGLVEQVTQPLSEAFATESQGLSTTLTELCKAEASQAASASKKAQAQWAKTVTAWEQLSAVAMGPLIERRSARQIDFQPTRPALIKRAMSKTDAPDAQAMQTTGTPAKGLPALEWLLWVQPVVPGSTPCRYATAVADDVFNESKALQEAFHHLAAAPPEEEAASVAMAEVFNQWVGSLEALRWAQIEKPLRSQSKETFPRASSGLTAQSWATRWSMLRRLAVGEAGASPPAPGEGFVSLALYMRGRGLIKIADAFEQGIERADKQMKKLQPQANPSTLLAASAELARLKRQVESDVAPALNISIGFSDADGD